MKIKSFDVNKIYLGNCLEKMKKLPSGSVDLIFADPPYDSDFIEKFINDAIQHLNKDGLLILESSIKVEVHPNLFHLHPQPKNFFYKFQTILNALL